MASSHSNEQPKLAITNALVALIGIGDYEDVPNETPKFKSLFLQEDAATLEKLCHYMNWTFISKRNKINWTVEEIYFFLETEIGELMFSSDGHMRFDGLIVCISSHGLKEVVITSDYKTMEKTAIHRIVSEKYPPLRKIPRIFVFDCCSGTGKRRPTVAAGKAMDIPKFQHGLSLGDMLHMGYKGWTSSTVNPDFNLVLVHAANPGYVAKMSKKGSYLLRALAELIQENVQKKRGMGLAQILEEVQNALDEKGKQHTVNQMNNSTRALVFQRNQEKLPSASFVGVMKQQKARARYHHDSKKSIYKRGGGNSFLPQEKMRQEDVEKMTDSQLENVSQYFHEVLSMVKEEITWRRNRNENRIESD